MEADDRGGGRGSVNDGDGEALSMTSVLGGEFREALVLALHCRIWVKVSMMTRKYVGEDLRG